MNKTALLVLRLSLAVTFMWIGVLIYQSPAAWGSYIQPWAAAFIPVPIEQFMLSAAVLDLAVGFFLLINIFTPLAALVAALHLIGVLVVTGINDVTVRDIGLLGASAALFLEVSQTLIKQRSWKDLFLPKMK